MTGGKRLEVKKTDKSHALREFDAEYFRSSGATLLAGVDEAGRGALAGPVVAAIVVVDPAVWFEGLNDSKQLTAAKRQRLYGAIAAGAADIGIGWASAREVDQINVLAATHLAAARAIGLLRQTPQIVLTDYLKLQGLSQPVEPLVKGDARSQAIAAASVIAKVTRDRMMIRLDAEYPEYGFASHKGYGARTHLEAIAQYGSSTIHRHTFRGVDWFDLPYRRSLTLQRLLAEIENGKFDPPDREIFLDRGWPLPEIEEELLEEALNRRREKTQS